MLSCTDRRGASVLAQRGAVRPHERQSAEHCRHQTRNVEVERIRFRCVLQPRPADGNSGSSHTTTVGSEWRLIARTCNREDIQTRTLER